MLFSGKIPNIVYHQIKPMKSETITQHRVFAGTSSSGDLQEALQHAIDAAKAKLNTDVIRWKLESISGANGGFSEVDTITVSIYAEAVEE